jgi:hypothetical protein
LLFEVGPYLYDVTNPRALLLYLIAAHFAVLIGYRSAWKSNFSYRQIHREGDRTARIFRVLAAAAVLSIVIFLADDFSRGLSINHVIEDPLASRDAWQEDDAGLGLRYVAVLLDAATIPFVGIGIFSWKICGWKSRLLLAVVVFLHALHAVIGASRATFFALGWIVVIALASCIASGRMKLKPARWAISSVSLLIVFVLYSSFIAQTRTGSVITDYAEFATENFDTRPAVIDLVRKLPPLSQAAVLQGAYYFSHSYMYLARCLQMDYAGSTYGFGFSRFLTRTYTKLSGSDALERRVYFERLVFEDHESPVIWVTGYAWIASDWTFPGSLIVLYVLGRWLAQSWREAVAALSTAAVPVMCWTFFIAAMLPIDCALSDYGSLISFAMSLIVWRVSRRYPAKESGIRPHSGLRRGIALTGSAT